MWLLFSLFLNCLIKVKFGHVKVMFCTRNIITYCLNVRGHFIKGFFTNLLQAIISPLLEAITTPKFGTITPLRIPLTNRWCVG